MDILDVLGFPLCQKTRVPIKTVVEQLGGETKHKKLLESHVASISLIGLLNEQTIRIRAYKDDDYSFQVIYVLDITLKANDQMTDLTELIHSAFPESTLLLLSYKDTMYISGALKRINKTDCTKTVITDSVWAEVFEDLSVEFPEARNLKEYYEFLVRLIYRIKAQNVTGLFPQVDREYKEQIKYYESLCSTINRLKEEYKNETMMNERIRIDDKIYKKEQDLQKLIEAISGGN